MQKCRILCKLSCILIITMCILSSQIIVEPYLNPFHYPLTLFYAPDNQFIKSNFINAPDMYNPAIIPLDIDKYLIIFAFGGHFMDSISGKYSYPVPNYCISSDFTCDAVKPLALQITDAEMELTNYYLSGFEDTRVEYYNGDLILIISCPSLNSHIQRTTCIISASQVIPELKQYINTTAIFPNLIRIDKVIDNSWIKNQIPLFLKNLDFIYSLDPFITYTLDPSGMTGNTQIQLNYIDPCMNEIKSNFPKMDYFHSGSNQLQLVLCNEDECTPNHRNTVLVSLIHPIYYRTKTRTKLNFYQRLLIARNITSPHNILFFSKPLFIRQGYYEDLIYSETIAYIHPKQEPDKNIGYLNTPVIYGHGIDMPGRQYPMYAQFDFQTYLMELKESC
eukprot:NODE_362_length_8790_cov_0.566678.p2 type:complete len:391 gc:universal NODE_362_length_8790_cov_0.566678:5700-6872(+)